MGLGGLNSSPSRVGIGVRVGTGEPTGDWETRETIMLAAVARTFARFARARDVTPERTIFCENLQCAADVKFEQNFSQNLWCCYEICEREICAVRKQNSRKGQTMSWQLVLYL